MVRRDRHVRGRPLDRGGSGCRDRARRRLGGLGRAVLQPVRHRPVVAGRTAVGGIWLVRRVVSVPPFVAQGIVSLLSPLVLALVSVTTFALARRLGGHVRTSVLAALGVAGGTFLLVYGKTFSSEPLAALLVTLAIERVLAGSPAMAGAALGGAALARPQTFLFAPFLLWGLWRQGVVGRSYAGVHRSSSRARFRWPTTSRGSAMSRTSDTPGPRSRKGSRRRSSPASGDCSCTPRRACSSSLRSCSSGCPLWRGSSGPIGPPRC